jgi:hypothetical protein
MTYRSFHVAVLLTAAPLAAVLSGCHWREQLKGHGFPAWSESLGAGARGSNADARPSGFFTDRRSEQIERNLGGGF